MKEMFREMISYRHLLFALALRDIKIKYKQSIMGFMWALFMPMMIVASGILVKKAFSIISGKPLDLSDIASVSVKALPWSFFVGAIQFGTNSLVTNMNLITKIYFPREVFPLSSILSNLLDFVIASITLTIILGFAGIGISIHILWLPLLIFLLVIFTSGLSLLLSCANLFFRDVKYIVQTALTFGIFFTPVFYDAKMFGKWAWVLLINPIGSLLEAINSVVVLHQPPDFFWLAYVSVCSLVFFLGSWCVFHRLEFKFAEYV